MNWINTLPPHVDADNASNELISQCIREWRNRQLASSDYTQLPDVSLTNKAEWAAYRQELRDMMDQNSDPKLIVFPEPPK